ncbi:MAG TPA: AAA family ATPase [Pirellulaceae bacterium]|nr:AAA family ATPase [Pirellulaceae bacterium]
MTNILRLALADPQDVSREALKAQLSSLDDVWLVGESSRYESFPELVEQSRAGVAIVNLDHDPQQALRLIQTLRRDHAECRVLAVGNAGDGQLILQVMRAGVRDFLPRPLQLPELNDALQRLQFELHGPNEGAQAGCNVIAVAGATGGVGTTSIAVNLASILARAPSRNVVLMDLDLALGDADVLLDAVPEYTLADLAQNVGRLDLSLLKRSLTKHRSGLYLLPRPVRLQEMSLIQPTDAQRVISLLKASFSHLIIDLSKSYSPLDMVALQAANHILLVTQLDLPSLRNVVRLLMSFDGMEGVKEKVKIVMNRVGLEHQHIGLKKARETMGRDVFWQLPNDYPVVVEVRNNGVPLLEQAPHAPITKSIVDLAEALCGAAPEEPARPVATPRAGWFSFWMKKQKAGV